MTMTTIETPTVETVARVAAPRRLRRRGRRRVWGTVFQRGGMWWIQYSDPLRRGRRMKEKVSLFRDVAEGKLVEIKRRIDRGEHLGLVDTVAITLEELSKLVEPIRRASLRPASFRSTAGHLRRAISHFGARPVREIRPADVRDFLASLRAPKGDVPGASPGTANRYRVSLSVLFKEAVSRGFHTTNPCAEVRPFREEVLPREYLAPVQVDRLLECASPRFRDIFTLLADTGLRRGEALDLTWRDLDATAGRQGALTIRHSKARRSRVIPLTARARAVLDDLLAARVPGPGSEWIFPRWRANPGRVSAAFRRARAKAGVGFEQITLHGLRHGFASGLVRAGVPIPTVGRLLGHAPSSLAVTARYSVHEPRGAIFEAVEALDTARSRPASRAAAGA